MADGDTGLRIGRTGLTLNTFGVTLPFAEYQVLVIDLTEIDNSTLHTGWHMIPQCYTLTEKGPWALSINDGSITG